MINKLINFLAKIMFVPILLIYLLFLYLIIVPIFIIAMTYEEIKDLFCNEITVSEYIKWKM